MFSRRRDGDAPVVLRLFDDAGEVGIEQQIMQRRIAFVGFDDAIKEFRANDATPAPDRGDVAEVQLPVVLVTRSAEELHALGIGDDLGRIERLTDCFDKLLSIAGEFLRFWLRQNFRRSDALVFARRNDARLDRGVDRGNNNRLLNSRLERPNAGPFLAGFIENNVDKWFARFGIDLAKDLGCDVDEIAIEVAFVPLGESVCQLRRIHSDHVFQNGVGFTDELHVAVLNAVVHHFDVVTRAIRSHVSTAGFAVDLCGDLAENRRDHFPGFARAAGHKRWTFERAFLSTRNTAANEMNPATFQIFAATLRVGEKRIAAVDDDVALFQQGRELSDDRINGRAGFHHDHRFAWAFEGADEFLRRACRSNIFSFAATGRKFLGDFRGAIENGDGKFFGFHVENEIFAHHRQADEANITLIRSHFGYLLVTPPSSGEPILASN